MGKMKRLIVPVGFALFFVAFFAHALFSGAYLASGDAILQGLPTYFGRTPLWEPNLMLGYPLFADPNQAFWYPVLRIMRLIPHAFNAYAIVPYVIGACGMYGFARRTSGSTTGGVVAGLTFSLGGFMTSHQGHLNLIHPAAWTPYILWSIEELRRHAGWLATAAGAGAFSLCALSGPQQPLAYVGLVAVAYAVVFAPNELRSRYWLHVAAMLVLGIGLSAISLIPTAEFVPLSSRAGQSYADFIVYSTGTFDFVVRALFPYALPDPAGFVESSNYAGIASLMLGFIALIRSTNRRQVWFWFAVAVWAAWMSMGDALYGADLAFHLPIYSLFRIPGRHALEFTIAIAALAAFGVAAIERGAVRTRDLAIATLPVTCIFCAVLAIVAAHSIAPLWALVTPCIVCAGSVIALVLWTRVSHRRVAALIGIVAVGCDLLSFAALGPHRFDTVPVSLTTAPADVARMHDVLASGGYRMLAPLGSTRPQAIPPNLSALWGVPAVGGYVSLEDRRVATLLQMLPSGEVVAPALPTLDLVGVRYMLFAPSTDTLDGFIGADRFTLTKALEYAVPSKRPATAIEVVSALGDSAAIPDRARVAVLIVYDDANRSFVLPILAGRDTSESAYEKPEVRSHVRHREAHVFSGDTEARMYIARFAVPTRRPLTRIAVRWTSSDPVHGALSIAQINVIDGSRVTPIAPIDRYFAEGHWRLNGSLGNDIVLENERAMPAAWTIAPPPTLPDDAQLAAIVRGQITSAARYGAASVSSDAPIDRSFAASCAQRCTLVVNQLFYPGWEASVDGTSAPVLRVDYLLTGVNLEPGKHAVRLWFEPRSLVIGATISALSLLAIAALFVFALIGGEGRFFVFTSAARYARCGRSESVALVFGPLQAIAKCVVRRPSPRRHDQTPHSRCGPSRVQYPSGDRSPC